VYHRDRALPDRPAADGPVEGVTIGADPTLPEGPADARWRDVVEALPGAVLLLNADQVCTYASPGVQAELGLTAASVVGTRPDVLVDPDHLPDVWRSRAEAAGGARAATSRVRVARPDGTRRWLDATTTQLRDPRDLTVYSAVHVRDATVEVRSQQALARSEGRYRQLLALLDEAVVQVDAAGRIESFNTRAVALLRHRAEELLGADFVHLLALRDGEGRPVPGPLTAPPVAAGNVAARNGAARNGFGADVGAPVWRSLGRGDGQRRLVRMGVASFDGADGAGGTVLVIAEARRPGAGGAAGPTLTQARSAAGLTAREGDVLDGLAAGRDVPGISRELGISVHSVRGHVKSITAKLGVHSQLQAVIAAAQRGMVDLGHPR